jgi:hypothetical protein
MSTSDDLVRAIQERDWASAQLAALRRAAPRGEYDAAEFDRAVVTYRAADAAVRLAGAASGPRPPAAGSSIATHTAAGPTGRAGRGTPDVFRKAMDMDELAEPFVPTARMRFVKWLVETGRLSDQR